MFDIGGGELLLIVLVILIMFGPKKLPELAQSLGRGMREFKRAQREFTEQISTAMSDEQRRERARSAHIPPTDTVPRTPLFPSAAEGEEISFSPVAEPGIEAAGSTAPGQSTGGGADPSTPAPAHGSGGESTPNQT